MRTLFLSITLIFSTLCSAQNFQGKATYKQHTKYKIKVNDPTLKKQIEAAMKNQAQKNYILHFTPTESIYQQEAQLNTPSGNRRQRGMHITFGGSSENKLYKNIKEKRFVEEKEIAGKKFLVADSLTMPHWELINKQKNIGKYTCYKAILKEKGTVNKLNKKTGNFEDKKEDFITTVWYTPDIPISNGPQKLFGLPGLILEVQYGKTTLACTEIVMNSNEKAIIEAPQKGKKVSLEKFKKIAEKRRKEIRKRYKSKRKGKNRHVTVISVER